MPIPSLEDVFERLKSKEHVSPHDVRTMFKEYAKFNAIFGASEHDRNEVTKIALDALKKTRNTTEENAMYDIIIDNFGNMVLTEDEKDELRSGRDISFNRPFKKGGRRSKRSRWSRRFRRTRK